jgi:hypothetical protein
MKLYKGHAVLPRVAIDGAYQVRTYVVIADNWQEARRCIGAREPVAHFVTVPSEATEPLVTDVRSIDAREFRDLRSACAWNEARLTASAAE